MTGHLPDYACLIVGANMGVVGMCKEHLGVALALKVPVFFVVTKVDICPEHVLKNTVQVRRPCGCCRGGVRQRFLQSAAAALLQHAHCACMRMHAFCGQCAPGLA